MQLIPRVSGARGDKATGLDFAKPDFQDPATPAILVILNAPVGARVAVFKDPPQHDGSHTLFIGVIEQPTVTFLADPAAYPDGEFMVRIRRRNLHPFECSFKLTPQKQAVRINYMGIKDWIIDADLEFWNEVKYNTGTKLDDYAVLAEFIIESRNKETH